MAENKEDGDVNEDEQDDSDLKLLVDCIRYQQDDESAQEQALRAIACRCHTSDNAASYLFYSHSVDVILKLILEKSSSMPLKVAALHVLCAVCENNDMAKKALCDDNVFVAIKQFLTMKLHVTLQTISCYFLICLVANDGNGQHLARRSKCIETLRYLFKDVCSPCCSPRFPGRLTVCAAAADDTKNDELINLWQTAAHALSVCVNNPQNVENQVLCSTVFPCAVAYLRNSQSSIIQTTTMRFVSNCLANNRRTQISFRLVGGLRVLCDLLTDELSTNNQVPSSELHSLVLTLEAAVFGNQTSQESAADLELIPLLLQCLQLSCGSPKFKVECLMTIGACIDDCASNCEELISHGGVNILINLLVENQNCEELQKSATCVLQTCSSQAKSLGVITSLDKAQSSKGPVHSGSKVVVHESTTREDKMTSQLEPCRRDQKGYVFENESNSNEEVSQNNKASENFLDSSSTTSVSTKLYKTSSTKRDENCDHIVQHQIKDLTEEVRHLKEVLTNNKENTSTSTKKDVYDCLISMISDISDISKISTKSTNNSRQENEEKQDATVDTITVNDRKDHDDAMNRTCDRTTVSSVNNSRPKDNDKLATSSAGSIFGKENDGDDIEAVERPISTISREHITAHRTCEGTAANFASSSHPRDNTLAIRSPTSNFDKESYGDIIDAVEQSMKQPARQSIPPTFPKHVAQITTLQTTSREGQVVPTHHESHQASTVTSERKVSTNPCKSQRSRTSGSSTSATTRHKGSLVSGHKMSTSLPSQLHSRSSLQPQPMEGSTEFQTSTTLQPQGPRTLELSASANPEPSSLVRHASTNLPAQQHQKTSLESQRIKGSTEFQISTTLQAQESRTLGLSRSQISLVPQSPTSADLESQTLNPSQIAIAPQATKITETPTSKPTSTTQGHLTRKTTEPQTTTRPHATLINEPHTLTTIQPHTARASRPQSTKTAETQTSTTWRSQNSTITCPKSSTSSTRFSKSEARRTTTTSATTTTLQHQRSNTAQHPRLTTQEPQKKSTSTTSATPTTSKFQRSSISQHPRSTTQKPHEKRTSSTSTTSVLTSNTSATSTTSQNQTPKIAKLPISITRESHKKSTSRPEVIDLTFEPQTQRVAAKRRLDSDIFNDLAPCTSRFSSAAHIRSPSARPIASSGPDVGSAANIRSSTRPTATSSTSSESVKTKRPRPYRRPREPAIELDNEDWGDNEDIECVSSKSSSSCRDKISDNESCEDDMVKTPVTSRVPPRGPMKRNVEHKKNSKCLGCSFNFNNVNSHTFLSALRTDVVTCSKHRHYALQLATSIRRYKKFLETKRNSPSDYEFPESPKSNARCSKSTYQILKKVKHGEQKSKKRKTKTVKATTIKVPFTEEDIEILRNGYDKYGANWSIIQTNCQFSAHRNAKTLKQKFESLCKGKHQRRQRCPFTFQEEQNLKAGVLKYGYNWKKIINTYQFRDRRTAQNLKDKWRNLVDNDC